MAEPSTPALLELCPVGLFQKKNERTRSGFGVSQLLFFSLFVVEGDFASIGKTGLQFDPETVLRTCPCRKKFPQKLHYRKELFNWSRNKHTKRKRKLSHTHTFSMSWTLRGKTRRIV
jgi:hypothetical protein